MQLNPFYFFFQFCFELNSCSPLPSVSTFVKNQCLDSWGENEFASTNNLFQTEVRPPQRNPHFDRKEIVKKSFHSAQKDVVECYAMVFNAFCYIRWQCVASRELHLITVTWSVKWSRPLPTGVVKTKQAPLFKSQFGSKLLVGTDVMTWLQ